MIERMAILGGQVLDESHLPTLSDESLSLNNQNKNRTLKDYKNQAEREYIIEVLKNTQGNISEAASILQIERTYLHKKIHALNIQKNEYFS